MLSLISTQRFSRARQARIRDWRGRVPFFDNININCTKTMKEIKSNKIKSLFFILISCLLCTSCTNEQKSSTTNVIKKKSVLSIDSCRVMLSHDIIEYIQQHVNEAIDERMNPFSMHSFRIIKDVFWTDSIERRKDWENAFLNNGLNKKDIEIFVNSRVKLYNTQNGVKLNNVRLSSIEMERIIDTESFQQIKTLDKCGAYDILEVLLIVVSVAIPYLGFILCGIIYLIFFPIGFVIGYLLSAIGLPLSRDGAKALATVLVAIFMGSIMLLLMYLCIQASGCLESNIVVNYLNLLNDQGIGNQL